MDPTIGGIMKERISPKERFQLMEILIKIKTIDDISFMEILTTVKAEARLRRIEVP